MLCAPPLSGAPGEAPETIYRSRHQAHIDTHQALLRQRTRALQLILADIAVFLALAFVRIQRTTLLAAAPYLVTAVLFVLFVSRYLVLQSRIDRESRLIAHYAAALARVEGSDPQSGYTGPPPSPRHLYDRSLDVLGPDSLFGLLCTVRTSLGERGLAACLTAPATYEETLLRQQAVQELAPDLQLRERITLLGTPVNRIAAPLLDQWLAVPAPVFPRLLRPLLIATAVVSVVLIRGFFSVHVAPRLALNFSVVIALQLILCALVRRNAQSVLGVSANLQRSVRLLAEALALMDSVAFTSPLLQRLQRDLREPFPAYKELQHLQSLLTIVEQRAQPYFLPFSLLTAAGTQAAISIAAWKRTHASAFALWVAAWSQFEALNALATYAFEHPQDAWPELLPPTHAPLYEARALGHPLLPSNAIRNDIALGGGAPGFYLISGSNMAGKSTLLRAIGLNAVLAYAGAPVRADSLRLTPLALGASIALTDSLAEGTSKFRAEVERLAAIARLSHTTPVLFLVDEIFSGTNSLDRRTAAEAVVRALTANGALGALSTHDLALTELATPRTGGLNVHMASPDAADPLAFDYRLKPGINTISNGLAIVRLLGLDA